MTCGKSSCEKTLGKYEVDQGLCESHHMEWAQSRFDLYGALYWFCNQYHSGQWSRGYRILGRLTNADYSPGLGLQYGKFESETQEEIYNHLVVNYAATV